METRVLGRSGLKVPVLCLGTATFGGTTPFFKSWGETDANEARRLVDVCLEAGLNFFDTADIYSDGASEEILGAAIAGRRDKILLATKATFPTGANANDVGSSRHHLIRACDASLKRLKTDFIDVYYMHGFDAVTPVEETLRALDTLVQSGKIRYVGASNFSGWHLAKSQAIAERYGWTRYVAHQTYYSLAGRELEWELMPAAKDLGLGTVVWSPLAGGALAGNIRRGTQPPANTRLGQTDFIPFDKERVYDIVDALDVVAKETSKTVAQVALNWLLQRPTVSSLVIGARNETQLRLNLGAVGWNLHADHVALLEKASRPAPVYPYWHQYSFPQLGHALP
ncbi:MAG: aldo/keto reductase [Silvanigrellales bacterium]|nr:aldo/keto reductase [Silvanigrellales bacterium]